MDKAELSDVGVLPFKYTNSMPEPDTVTLPVDDTVTVAV